MKPANYVRRKHLLEDMTQLESRGISCLGCSGTCCTEVANSMMVTPIEAVDLYSYLFKNEDNLEELKLKLQTASDKYKLDILPPGIKNKSRFRRTYTCPFFLGSEFGCPLPRDVKPYGCLGFNRQKKEADIDQDCWSNIDVLKAQESSNLESDKALNEWIRKDLKIDWEKDYLPLAIIQFIDIFKSQNFENFLERARLTAPFPID